MADIKRKASLRSGAEQLYDKLTTDSQPSASAIAQDYMYHLGVGSDDPRLELFRVSSAFIICRPKPLWLFLYSVHSDVILSLRVYVRRLNVNVKTLYMYTD